jgi:hypothetical protein
MTIELKLDANGIDKLFADADAKLRLQNAVIAEICKRMFTNWIDKDVVKLVDAAFSSGSETLAKTLFENENMKAQFEKMFNDGLAQIKKDAWSSNTSVKLKPEAKAALDKALKEQVEALMKEYAVTGEQLITAAAQAAFERVQEKAMANIDAQINRKVSSITMNEIDRKVTAAMDIVLKVAKS